MSDVYCSVSSVLILSAKSLWHPEKLSQLIVSLTLLPYISFGTDP